MKNKYFGPDKPIKTKEEWNEVFEKQAKVISDTLKITMDQARVRQYALIESGIMDQGPLDHIMKIMIDDFLSHPGWDKQPKHFGESV